jgi:BarA-like signal transduction histidine kinase
MVATRDLKISDECMESLPCQHVIEYEGLTTGKDGVEIYKLLTAKRLPIPAHFLEYASWAEPAQGTQEIPSFTDDEY